MIPEDEPIEMDPPPVEPEKPIIDTTNLRVASSPNFDGYLTDGSGQALYMFVDDVISGSTSACLNDCARDWPPFDIAAINTAPGIDRAEVARFHRQDGEWQTTYKGHPLYYRASEKVTREVTGDGVDKRWFVARDYLVFLSTARTFTPAGGTTTDGAFLTDGFGRTLYVCLEDKPSTDTMEAVSSCDATCTVTRPVFENAETDRTTLLPSVISPSELRALVRPDGQLQLTYRGWPLYRHTGDIIAGSTAGHNELAWRAIDPVSYGLAAMSE